MLRQQHDLNETAKKEQKKGHNREGCGLLVYDGKGG
jgi:hypothetical protein